ncbi:MAG: hypothetical protein NT126_09440 [Bacteroidetes bacterium]|nr:hypothetical protein [Bacteroidota bacterium]
MPNTGRIPTILFLFFISTLVLGSCQKDHFTNVGLLHPGNDYIVAGDAGPELYYYDLNPDWEKHGFGLFNDSVNLDINGDHVVDISFKYTTYISGTEYDQQTSVSSFNGSAVSVMPKNISDTIDASSAWTTSPALLCFTKINMITPDTAYTGPWQGVENHYIGIKIIQNGQTVYGWVRMSVLIRPAIVYIQQIIVKDFACRRSG